MFSGPDYHREFEQACDELAEMRHPKEDVRNTLIGIEWVLWEAIRGVFGYAAFAISLPALGLYRYLVGYSETWSLQTLIEAASFLVLAGVVYGVLRAIFFFEISRHVKGRKFGKLPYGDGGAA
jgi:hypothetical protein